MYAIMKKEFLSLFKSFKSIAVIAFFILVTYFVSRFLNKLPITFGNALQSPYVYSIRALVVLFGFLFGLSLSHDTLNREIETQTLRYVLPRTKRMNIILGKFFGIYLFWFVCISVSFLIVSYFAEKFSFIDYIQMLSYMAYVAGFTILLSLLVKRSTYTMFLSAVLGIVIPAFSAWLCETENFARFLKYIFPLYYIAYKPPQLPGDTTFFEPILPFLNEVLKYGFMLVPFVLAMILLAVTLLLFQRSDF